MKLQFLAFLLGLMSCEIVNSQSPLIIRDWANVQAELAESFDDNSGYFDKSTLFKKIKASQDHQIYMEMMAQREYPIIVLAGFLCLNDAFPHETLKPAMNSILQAKYPGTPFYAPIWRFLQHQTNSDELYNAFTSVAVGCGGSTENFETLVELVPYDFLYNWYNDQRGLQLYGSSEAVILDRLYGESKENHRMISTNMMTALARMQLMPGTPRYVFVLYADTNKDTIMKNLGWVLEENDLSSEQLPLLVVRRRQFVEEIMSKNLDLPKGRHDEIEKLILQGKSR